MDTFHVVSGFDVKVSYELVEKKKKPANTKMNLHHCYPSCSSCKFYWPLSWQAVYLVVTFLAWLWTEHRAGIPAMGSSGKRYTTLQVVIRAIFAGTIVGGVVAISNFVPAYLTGNIGTFPAVLFSSMVILAVNQGKEFARATGKMMILSSTNIVIYAISVNYTFPVLGVAGGTLVSLVLAVLWVKYVLHRFVYRTFRIRA